MFLGKMHKVLKLCGRLTAVLAIVCCIQKAILKAESKYTGALELIYTTTYISQVKSVNQGTSTTQPLLHHLHEGRTVYLWHSYGSTMYDASHPSSILHPPFLHVNGLIASFQQCRPDRFFLLGVTLPGSELCCQR